MGGCIIMQQEKISRAKCSWTNLLNALQKVIDPLLLSKILHLLIFFWYEFFMYYALRVEKNYQHGLDAGPMEFQFLWLKGCLTNPFKTLLISFGVIRKTPGLISVIILLQKFLSASAITIMSWQDAPPSSLCSGVKECGTNMHTTFSFPNPLSESEELQSWGCSKILLSFLMRFDSHF